VDLNGIVLLDKDPGITSFKAVKKVKGILGVKKAGHAGTLDKFASGLLIVCLGYATSFQNIFMEGEKIYRATIRFGKQTDTLDPYGRVVRESPVKKITKDSVEEVLNSFTGEIEQRPPAFSAIHVGGKRLYKKAIRGEDVEVPTRRVYVHWLRLIEIRNDSIVLEAKVSKGTYIRSLARDIAERLDTVGYCESLRRMSIGVFDVEKSVKIDAITPECVIQKEEALSFLPAIEVDENTAKAVSNGMPVGKLISDRSPNINNNYIRILCKNRIIAILEKNRGFKYFKVIGMRSSDNS